MWGAGDKDSPHFRTGAHACWQLDLFQMHFATPILLLQPGAVLGVVGPGAGAATSTPTRETKGHWEVAGSKQETTNPGCQRRVCSWRGMGNSVDPFMPHPGSTNAFELLHWAKPWGQFREDKVPADEVKRHNGSIC